MRVFQRIDVSDAIWDAERGAGVRGPCSYGQFVRDFAHPGPVHGRAPCHHPVGLTPAHRSGTVVVRKRITS